jgi:hypothetical protein
MIIGTIMILSSITIAMGFITSIGVTGGQESDRSQLNQLHSEIENKCQDASTPSPSTVSTTVDIEFQIVEELSVEGNSLVGDNPEGNDYEYSLEGCNYDFTGFPASTDGSNSWTFEISHEEDSGYPPTINVEASSS